MKNKKYIVATALFTALATLSLTSPAFAQNEPATIAPAPVAGNQGFDSKMGPHREKRGDAMQMRHFRKGMMQGDARKEIQSLTGNGQPLVGGTVASVNGATMTITNKSNLTYTVDTAHTTVTKTGVPSATASSISVGDNVLVQGAVNGTTVTATSVIDHGATPVPPTTNTPAQPTPQVHNGFFGSVKGFFSRFF
jgi:hypothetical protein